MIKQFQLGTGTRYGAAGFALGLALAGTIYAVISINSRELNAGMASALLPLTLAGLIGGGTLGATRRRGQHILLGALATAIALPTGFAVANILIALLRGPHAPDEFGITFSYILRFVLIGAWAGILLAAAQRDWERVGMLALAGACGFGLGAIVLDQLGRVLAQPMALLVPGFIGDPGHDSLALAVTWGISFAAAGIVAGAALGYAIDRRPLKHA